MKSLTLFCLFLGITTVFCIDCVPSADHGSSTVIPLAGTKVLTFKGVKPQIKFVAAPLGTAPSLKVVGSSAAVTTALKTGSKGSFFEILSSKCPGATPALTSTPAPAPAPAPATAPTSAPAPVPAPSPADSSSRRSSTASIAIMVPLAFASLQVSPLAATLVAILAIGANVPYASAQECTDASAVEVHMDHAAADGIIADAWKADHTCPPESFWWKHHPDVWDGYEGCVTEIGLIPCGTNGFNGNAGRLAAKLPYTYDSATKKCVSTGFTIADEKMIIGGGLPHDGPELKKRTGMHPVVSFPLLRSPYPRYLGSEAGIDDDEDMKATLKQFMMYQGAFTKDELDGFSVMANEGAEQGMVTIHAAKALEIAATTCNRQIYVLVEAPSYGYTTSRIQQLVNDAKSSHLKVHLNWFNATSNATENFTCPTDDVTVTTVGWFPGTAYPSRVGSYGVSVIATSADPTSPWYESMVFPENPSGAVKTQNLPSTRLVCDGCYLYPTYFGSGNVKGKATGAEALGYYSGDMTEGYYIPKAKMPKCDAWAFSITKMYSASVRAGTVLYNTNNPYYTTIGRRWSSLSEGSVSEWTWSGQIQIWKMLMSKPLYHPKSWMGAYAKLQDEKSQALVDGFKNCPVIDYLNPKTTAYSFYKYKSPYDQRNSQNVPQWWLHTLNIASSDYRGSFRGANPSDYYGAGTTIYDFQRLHLYRDLSVYQEVGRRAKIVCGGGKLPGMMSTAEWSAVVGTPSAGGRKMLSDEVYDTSHVNHNDHTTIHLNHFSEAEKNYHHELHRQHLAYQAIMTACEEDGDVDTECMFRAMDVYTAGVAPVTSPADSAAGALGGTLLV